MADAYCGEPFSEPAFLPPNFCVHRIPLEFSRPRSIIALGPSDFLVWDRGSSAVVVAVDTNDDGVPDERVTMDAKGGNHGLAYHDGYLYISSDTTVWRWFYEWGSTSVGSTRETVVVNMNADGQGGAPLGHTTRTLIFDKQGRLYIAVGSNNNVDPDSYRSRIRRLSVDNEASFPVDFQEAEVFADGLRNEVGLGFDRHGILWGVENGADNLFRDDLGGDIHEDNPAEELNRFPEELAGQHWGYPFCWTEFNLPNDVGLGRGSVWTWPSFLSSVTDEQCRSDYLTSEMAMQGHSAPLGIVFYNYTDDRPASCTGGAFPQEMDGYAFIAFHGSWNRDVPTGYKVVYVPMTEDGRVDSEQPIDLFRHDSVNARWNNDLRPVDVDFDDCGRLLVTNDGNPDRGGSSVLRFSYNAVDPSICCGSAPSGSPTGTPTTSPPTTFPTSSPSEILTGMPTTSPTTFPTELPTTSPTTIKTELPTALPPTPIFPTEEPSRSPTTSAGYSMCGNAPYVSLALSTLLMMLFRY